MSEPLGDKRKRLDNLLQSTVEEHNQQADKLLGVFQRDFPRTYRLLDGSHFQLPARREADYPHYRYAVYDNARTFISATTQLAGRSGLDVDAWCRVRGECQVLNEWMKRGTTTLFVVDPTVVSSVESAGSEREKMERGRFAEERTQPAVPKRHRRRINLFNRRNDLAVKSNEVEIVTHNIAPKLRQNRFKYSSTVGLAR